jgi:hypothetical protein
MLNALNTPVKGIVESYILSKNLRSLELYASYNYQKLAFDMRLLSLEL